jgi:alkaline phosphatase/alkaline phosphatase D
MDRRSFLRIAGAGAGTLVLASSMPAAAAPAAKPYFQHGVASGDPLPDRVVLWTRVSPTAAAFPGPAPAQPSMSGGRWLPIPASVA